MEPDTVYLASIGLESVDTLVGDGSWTVVPVSNRETEPIYLKKGAVLGQFTAAELVSVWEKVQVEIDGKEPLDSELIKVMKESQIDTNDRMDQLGLLLRKYQKAFTIGGEPLGRTDRVKHSISTGNAEPYKTPYRRLPMLKKRVVEEHIVDMLEQKVIIPSISPWSSPVQMVTKKDGTMRFCIDYRKLNGVTKKNAYPLPRIDETLDSLGGNNWFCSLDLQSGYWQIAMQETDKEKTAFSSHVGLYQFELMPFGLCNAPATFEAMMETMLSDLLWKRCLVYLDDIIIFGKTFE